MQYWYLLKLYNMGSSLYLYLFLVLYCFTSNGLSNSSSSTQQPLCHEDESSALLQFKHSFVINKSASGYPSAYPKFRSWKLHQNASDCCLWDGVECDHVTGHVIGLDLSSSFLYGSINSNSSLFNLVHIRRLNLADNDFNFSQIPTRIGYLSGLTYLNLSFSGFSGQIPSEISNLSKLAFLDLSEKVNFNFENLLKLGKPGLRNLVQNLTNLKVLDLSDVNISSTVPSDLSNMSSLTTLRLSSCLVYGEMPMGIFRLPNLQILDVSYNEKLTGYLPVFDRGNPPQRLAVGGTNFFGTLPNSIGNVESLSFLDLSGCNFSGTLPGSLGNLAQLTFLNLALNNFTGQIPTSVANLSQLSVFDIRSNELSGTLPASLGNLAQLTFLDLSFNKFTGQIPSSVANLSQLSLFDIRSNQLAGQIPSWLGNLTRLTFVDCSHNQLQGMIPSSISQLNQLEELSLTNNNLSGEVKLDIFLQLPKLTVLQLSGNNLAVHSTNSTNTTFTQFEILALESCNLKEFPYFLRFQNEMEVLFLAGNNLDGQIPSWLWNTSKETMTVVGLANNFLTSFGLHPNVIPWRSLISLDLAFNSLQGPLPILSPSTTTYTINGNWLTGEIPRSICHSSSLSVLDLSENNLSGIIPQCLASETESLAVLNLSSNNFHGFVPQTFVPGIKMIDLSQNQLHGPIPRSLANCTVLEILVLGNNQIEDTFPSWLGYLPMLRILVLRSNKLHGSIENPKSDVWFPKLQIIDLSHNDLSGNLSSDCIRNWIAMKIVRTETSAYMGAISISTPNNAITTWTVTYNYKIILANKGTQRLYKILDAFVFFDMSNNKFSGEIPESLGSLSELQALNFSHNNFTGVIPLSMGNLTQLESLDLSQNLLSGEIPQELTQLNFLAVLNISHNHLTGPIPRGKQFDTFENSSYGGNLGLCGVPLSKLCGNPEASPRPPPLSSQGNDSGFSIGLFRGVIAMGYGSGLIVGVIIGHALTTRYHEWFIWTFGKEKKTQRRKRRVGRRN